MSEAEWNALSPVRQSEAWWQELTRMLDDALLGIRYQSGNDITQVVSGLTSIVAEQKASQ